MKYAVYEALNYYEELRKLHTSSNFLQWNRILDLRSQNVTFIQYSGLMNDNEIVHKPVGWFQLLNTTVNNCISSYLLRKIVLSGNNQNWSSRFIVQNITAITLQRVLKHEAYCSTEIALKCIRVPCVEVNGVTCRSKHGMFYYSV
jgi:hypothetical protein